MGKGYITHDRERGVLALDGRDLDLDRSSRAILLSLVEADGEAVGKAELLKAGWPDRIVHENSLAKAIGRIRTALGEEASRIEAIYGRGYVLIPVRTVHPDEAAMPGASDAGDSPHVPETPAETGPGASKGFGPKGPRKIARFLPAAIVALVLGAIGVGLYAAAPWRSTAPEEPEDLIRWLSSDVLVQADPYSPVPKGKSLRAVIEKTAATMDERFADRPDTRIALHRVIANAFSGWGEYQKGVFHLDAAAALEQDLHGTRTPTYGKILSSLCQQLRLEGRTDRARDICASAVATNAGIHAPGLAAAQVAQAKLFFETGDYAEATRSLEAILNKDRNLQPPVEADANWFLGLSARKLGRFAQADAAFRRNLELRRGHWGEDHPLTAWALADYADFLIDSGDYTKAEPMLHRARAIFSRTLGPEHPESLSPVYSLGVLRIAQGRPQEARELLVPVLTRYRKELGSDHFWTLYAMTELALADAQAGRPAEARDLLGDAQAIGARALYGLDAKAAHFHITWARTLLELGDAPPAKREIVTARREIDRSLGAVPSWQAKLHCLSARLAQIQGARGEERREAELCLASLQASEAPSHYPLRAVAESLLRSAGPST